MQPKVSVILLSFNQVKYIQKAINSIFEQSYENWELIISDNGSTDGTQDICKKYKNSEKVKLQLFDSNEFITKRYKQAINEATGEYISILYGDDYYLAKKIETQVNLFKNLGEDWGVVHGPGFSLDERTGKRVISVSSEANGESLKTLLEDYFRKGFINPISPLIKKVCFDNYPSYEDIFTEAECLFFKFSLSYKFFYFKEPLVVMREHETNARWHSKRNIEILDICLDRLSNFEEFPQECLGSLSSLRVRTFNLGAWESIRLGIDSKWTRNRIYQSLKIDSLQIFNIRNIIAYTFTFLPNILVIKLNNLIDFIFSRKRQNYFQEPWEN